MPPGCGASAQAVKRRESRSRGLLGLQQTAGHSRQVGCGIWADEGMKACMECSA